MFTGIIQELGVVQLLNRRDNNYQLTVAAPPLIKELGVGDSIAVNGVCLTVVSFSDTTFTSDISPETARCSNLGFLKKGNRVNLETALTLSQKLGGHLITGHIDGIGALSSIFKQQDSYVITVKHDVQLNKYIAVKGSVAVDGVSLTIAQAEEDFFRVAIIPHTFAATIFQYKKVGDSVNVECDIISKYLERLLVYGGQIELKNKPGLDIDYLIKRGF